MTDIQVARSSYKRSVAREPQLPLKNRFFESNPILNAGQEFPSLISRPRLKKFAEVGTGHIRKIYSETGAFDDDVFVVSGVYLYRITRGGVSSLIGAIGTNILGDVSMAATAGIGDGPDAVPEYLFIADGGVLWVYTENGAATGHFEATGAIANADTVEIDGIYYKWTNASVDAGAPAGTLANPWLVNLGASNSEAITALAHAINGDGTVGTDYSTSLTTHATATAYSYAANDMYVAAKQFGAGGNTITTTETGANTAWDAATLADGGTASLRQVAMPNDVGAISVAHINSYVVVVPAQGYQINGRFYWIDPGEVYVDPLNFATAERSPDAINQVLVFSDRFWLLGQTTTEPWLTTGNATAPMLRFSGVLYDRGTWEGSGIRVKDSMVLVDEDGAVFQIGGGLKRLSRPDIEQRIRNAITAAATP
jgi:hypothetical protein